MPNKLEKFAELNTFSNTLAFHHFDIPNGFAKKGKWHEEMFKNQNPIVLELGCGTRRIHHWLIRKQYV
jgi:tRNA (guanine-N7-)-methyltransferase